MATGLTTKEVASKLNITGKQLRRILRSFDRFADGTYTRYNLGKKDVEQVTKALANRGPSSVPTKKATKKAKRTQKPPVETVTEATV